MSVLEYKPPEPIEVPETEPLVFLAGPIQGSPDWQSTAIDRISAEHEGLHIANPRISGIDHEFVYSRQVRWERNSIFRAARLGVVVFWLAKQDLSLPYKKDRSYAQTTRFEFGMMYTLAKLGQNPNIVLGMEPGYTGSEKYYRDVADELGWQVHEDQESVYADTLVKLEEIERIGNNG